MTAATRRRCVLDSSATKAGPNAGDEKRWRGGGTTDQTCVMVNGKVELGGRQAATPRNEIVDVGGEIKGREVAEPRGTPRPKEQEIGARKELSIWRDWPR
jgi:hypothetical protein